MQASNPLLIVPVLSPLIGALLCSRFHRKRITQQIIGVVTTLFALIGSAGILNANVREGVQIYRLAPWIPPFNIVLVADMLSALFVVMSSAVLLVGVLYTFTQTKNTQTKSDIPHDPLFMPFYLFIGAGVSGAFFTGDVFTLVIAVECVIIAAVILSLLSGGKSLPKRTSGEKPDMPPAIRYLLINLVGMLALLAGSFALYGAFETVNIASIASRLEDGQRSLLVQVAAFLLMGGFLVKSGVFPFHFGQPAFQIAAPIPISMIFAAAVLKIGVYGLLRLIALMFTAEAVLIQTLLLGLGAAGIAFGVWGAWRSQSAKGKLTHVSFGIIGVILIGIGVGTVQTLTGAIVLAVIHGIAVTALYALIGMPDSRYTMPTILIGTGALIAVLFTPLVEASVRAAVELAYPYLYVEPVIEAMQPAP